MGFRIRKSINLGSGVRVNLSKKGVGYSVGTKGYRLTKKAGGGIRSTTSIPGTGISYIKETHKSNTVKKQDANAPTLSGSESSTETHVPGSSLTASELKNPQKSLEKYQNSLKNRIFVTVVFLITCVATTARQEISSFTP